MTVRAKFKVVRFEAMQHYRDASKELRTIVLSPVTDGSAENKEFYDATPSG